MKSKSNFEFVCPYNELTKNHDVYFLQEVIKGGKYNKKADLWSLGCLIYELCSLSPPFIGPNIKHLVLKIEEGK
jgi:serine/threonine protein kinase